MYASPSFPALPRSPRPACAAAQNRNQRPPKGDVDGAWKHDMFHADRSLSARLTNAAPAPPKMNFGIADKALREAVGEKGGLSIKGASSRGNVVQVAGLAKGTTAADVEVSSSPSFVLRSSCGRSCFSCFILPYSSRVFVL